MGSTQLYNLTWAEFGSSLTSVVKMLRSQNDLVDVTLAAGGKSFPAHKLVLSAASPFLYDLLKSTPCQHPVVMLAGIAADDLEALLEFVYKGEVSVDPNRLTSLLQAADLLNIMSLTNSTDVSDQMKYPQTEFCGEPKIHLPYSQPRKNLKRKHSAVDSSSDWFNQENSTHDVLEGECSIPLILEPEVQMVDVETPILKLEEPENVGDETVPQPVFNYPKTKAQSEQPGMCPLCGSVLRQSRNLRRHLLTSCKYRMMGTNLDGQTVSPIRPLPVPVQHSTVFPSVENYSKTDEFSIQSGSSSIQQPNTSITSDGDPVAAINTENPSADSQDESESLVSFQREAQCENIVVCTEIPIVSSTDFEQTTDNLHQKQDI